MPGGRLRASSGTILLDDETHNDSASLSASISLMDVADSDLLVNELQVLDHLVLAKIAAGNKVPLFFRATTLASVEEGLSLLKDAWALKDLISKKAGDLSAGQRQILSIAIALKGEKRALLCDESTAHLDPKNARLFFDLMGLIATQHVLPIVIVTHDLLHAAEFAKSVYLVSDGKVINLYADQSKDLANRIRVLEEAFSGH